MAASFVVQVITAPVLPTAWIDTPVIIGAVISFDSGSSVIGGVCIGGAVSDFPGENESIANIVTPIIAAKQTSPKQITRH